MHVSYIYGIQGVQLLVTWSVLPIPIPMTVVIVVMEKAIIILIVVMISVMWYQFDDDPDVHDTSWYILICNTWYHNVM